MKFNSLASFASLFALVSLCSCGGEEKEVKIAESQNNVEIGNKIETFEDAKNFLPSWKKDNIVVFHTLGDPGDMHPTNGQTAQRQEITLYTQVFLLSTDFKKLDLYPHLAIAKPEISSDGLEYTYTLKTDLTWDDGSVITAEDVIFTFKANMCPLVNNPHAKPYFESINDIIALAPNKVKFMMRDNYVQNLYVPTDFPLMQRYYFDKENLLSKYSFKQFNDKNFIADKDEKLKKWAEEFNSPKYGHNLENIVGAGPYKIESWESGQSVTLVKKQNHWTKNKAGLFENAFPEKIIFKVSTDPTSTKLDFLNQVYDGTGMMDVNSLFELKSDTMFTKNYNFKFMDSYIFSYIGLNTKPDGVKHSKLFTDVKTRKAMAMLIPYDEINSIVYKNVYRRIATPVSHLKEECNTDLKLIETNIDAAKKLLAEEGWKDSNGDQILDKLIDGKKSRFKI